MSEKTSDMIYVATVNHSETDRLDVLYVGFNRERAIEKLWTSYNSLHDEYVYDMDDEEKEKYDKDMFIKAAENPDNSAFIQLPDFHINFELHTCPYEDITDAV